LTTKATFQAEVGGVPSCGEDGIRVWIAVHTIEVVATSHDVLSADLGPAPLSIRCQESRFRPIVGRNLGGTGACGAGGYADANERKQ
jgi:hypothetical protein